MVVYIVQSWFVVVASVSFLCFFMFVFFFLFFFLFFFFNDTATTEIYTLSLHDALPICSTWGINEGDAMLTADVPYFLRIRDVQFLENALILFAGICSGSQVDNHLHQRLFTLYPARSEEHTSELQSLTNLVCRLLLEKKKKIKKKKKTWSLKM